MSVSLCDHRQPRYISEASKASKPSPSHGLQDWQTMMGTIVSGYDPSANNNSPDAVYNCILCNMNRNAGS